MRIRWRGFELPSKVTVEKETRTNTYAKFIAEPFEQGFGTTIGNSLRRALLSSIEGAAVTHVRIRGVQHEFSTIPGVYEDVPDIILNIKQMRVKLHKDTPSRLFLQKKGQGIVKAGDFEGDESVSIVNKDLPIATITNDNTQLIIELDVRTGRGYVSAEENRALVNEIGVIPVDSIFSPVLRVRYTTENTRVGYKTNYDRLVMEIWTDGTVTPEMALVEAGKILRKHLNPFVQYYDAGREFVIEDQREDELRKREERRAELRQKLMQPISILGLGVRASNCLEGVKIRTIRDIVTKTEQELLSLRNFGKTSLKEVKSKLEEIGLSLGMDPSEIDEKL
ncbi:MAG: DNA-directed RNA polymerase subunit alpha [Planctomycetota bacterium]|nr:DNA-directed RNA polymerase subunit alpha [Planctomycetota bacterium]